MGVALVSLLDVAKWCAAWRRITNSLESPIVSSTLKKVSMHVDYSRLCVGCLAIVQDRGRHEIVDNSESSVFFRGLSWSVSVKYLISAPRQLVCFSNENVVDASILWRIFHKDWERIRHESTSRAAVRCGV